MRMEGTWKPSDVLACAPSSSTSFSVTSSYPDSCLSSSSSSSSSLFPTLSCQLHHDHGKRSPRVIVSSALNPRVAQLTHLFISQYFPRTTLDVRQPPRRPMAL